MEFDKTKNKMDFGWSWGMMNGNRIIAIILILLAILLFTINSTMQIIAFIVFLFGLNSFLGSLVVKNFKSLDFVTLPYVDLLKSDNDHVLDACCGSGRTSIAIGKVIKNGKITAVDRFDADYIKDGGKKLLVKNFALAG